MISFRFRIRFDDLNIVRKRVLESRVFEGQRGRFNEERLSGLKVYEADGLSIFKIFLFIGPNICFAFINCRNKN